jgi:hypothetical protein
MGLRHRTAHGPQQYDDHGSLTAWVEVHNVDFLAYTNAEIEEARALPAHRGFHVVRDPRDVLVSGYFSHKNSHPTDGWPELKEHRQALQSLSKEEGLLKEIKFSRPFLTAMRNWDYNQKRILEVKMEQLTQDPETQFRRVLRHLGIFETEGKASLLRKARQYGNRLAYKIHHEVPLSLPQRITREETIHPNVLGEILDDHRFEKLTDGRSRGETDPESHLRKGEPGDWKNHFTSRVAEAFEDAYDDIVVELGYEATRHSLFNKYE